MTFVAAVPIEVVFKLSGGGPPPPSPAHRRNDAMLIQQGTNPILTVVLQLPVLTAGVPSWSDAITQYEVWTEGTAAVGAGAMAVVEPAGLGPGVVRITTNVADFPTTGQITIIVQDAGANTLGSVSGQVVAFNPYT